MKIPQLTFTRFLAAIAIVFFHDEGNAYPLGTPFIRNWISFSNVFVSYFFVLSGFILVVSSVKDDRLAIGKKAFWFNRFARIYPLYFFALAMYLGLCLMANTPNTKLTFDQLILTTTLLQAWIPKYVMAYNYVSWTLSIEALFYLIFPFLILAMARMRLSVALWIGIAIWVISLLIYIYVVDQAYPKLFTDYFPLLHVNSFIGGVVAGQFFIKYKPTFVRNRNLILMVFLVLSAIVLGGISFHNHFIRQYYHNGLFAPLFLSLILYLSSLEEGVLKRMLSHPVLQYLGEISYGIYILQLAVSILVTGLNNRFFHLSHTTTFYLYVLVLIAFCALCHEFIEKPCRVYLKSVFSKLQMTRQPAYVSTKTTAE